MCEPGSEQVINAARRWDFEDVRNMVAKRPTLVSAHTTSRNWSLLHLAAEAGDRITVAFLVEYGADTAAITTSGETPAAVAHPGCRDLLSRDRPAWLGTLKAKFMEKKTGLTMKDVEPLLRAGDPNMTQVELRSVFNAADTNKDGRLQLDGLIRLVDKGDDIRRQLRRDRFADVFRSCDANGDGWFDLDEFCAFFWETCQSTMNIEESKLLFNVADKDGDGKVFFAELLDFLEVEGHMRANVAIQTGSVACLKTWVGDSSTLERAKCFAMQAAKIEFPFKGYIPKTEHRAITLDQLARVVNFAKTACKHWHDLYPPAYSKTSGKVLDIAFLNLYHLNEWLIRPATKDDNCAFVELLTPCAQAPKWFVSHWWGECIVDFAGCIRRHAELRMLDEYSAYWVCAYANRQHALSAEVSMDPKQTSFYRAMQLADGVVLILDRRSNLIGSGPGTPFTRIWCAFEESVALADTAARQTPMLLDIATTIDELEEGSRADQKVVLLSDGPTGFDGKGGDAYASYRQAYRQSAFPLEILHSALELKLEEAFASVEADRIHILNCIAGRDLEATPPLEAHSNYEFVNARLRAIFAIAAWPQAVKQGIVTDLMLPERLADDITRECLSMEMGLCSEVFDNSDLTHLSNGLLPLTSLMSLHLNFAGCERLTDVELLFHGLTTFLQLTRLSLSFRNCKEITSASSLGGSLKPLVALSELKLDFGGLSEFTSTSTLAEGLKPLRKLRLLCLNFTACPRLASLDPLAAPLAGLAVLEELDLRCCSCPYMEDVQELGTALEQLRSLKKLTLGLRGCEYLPEKLQCWFRSVSQLRKAFRECR